MERKDLTNAVKGRDSRIDLLKGIAIISVVFYHFSAEYLPYGYLGVEIFFVISGMLLMKSILRSFNEGNFNVVKIVFKKIMRLLPSVLIVSSLALLVGYFVMLPDDYENLAESVFASIFFANNILANITTKNYWDAVNTVKPLMHTWYLGVLMQSFIFLIIIYYFVYKFSKNKEKGLFISTLAVTIISFILYCIPNFSDATKFYEIPFRLFEITIGALIVLKPFNKQIIKNKKVLFGINMICYGLILFILLYKETWGVDEIKLILTVLLTVIILYNSNFYEDKKYKILYPVTVLGKSSFSIYLVHQVIIAFMYYFIVEEATPLICLAFLGVTALFAIANYWLVERPVSIFNNIRKNKILEVSVSCVILLVSSICSLCVYFNAGVVRDVPELDINMSNIHKGMHAEYCDKPYSWNKDFKEEGKIKVLVLGNSFGRDWANVLNESKISEKLEISYIYTPSAEEVNKYEKRYMDADFIFLVLGPYLEPPKQYLFDALESCNSLNKMYVVGNKYFGVSNGIIYSNRNKDDYFESTVQIPNDIKLNNENNKNTYKDKYIDLIEYVTVSDNVVRVFTDDGKFISQDCQHLTKNGAKYFASKIDFSFLIGN